MSVVIELRCPHCNNTMKYATQDRKVYKKRKTCVYCGKSFRVDTNILKGP